MLCPKCKMVCYCSAVCMKADATLPLSSPLPGHCVEVCDALRSASSEGEDADRSELESYPSTLSNVLLSHHSFSILVQEGGRKVGKKGRRCIQIHIIGASLGSEVWEDDGAFGGSNWMEAYSDALDEVCETFDVEMEIVFVGEGLEGMKGLGDT